MPLINAASHSFVLKSNLLPFSKQNGFRSKLCTGMKWSCQVDPKEPYKLPSFDSMVSIAGENWDGSLVKFNADGI